MKAGWNFVHPYLNWHAERDICCVKQHYLIYLPERIKQKFKHSDSAAEILFCILYIN